MPAARPGHPTPRFVPIGWIGRVALVVATACWWGPGASALPAAGGAAAMVTLPCSDQIGASSGAEPSRTTVLGTVALTTRAALGAGPAGNGSDPTARYFAKDGLQFRAGSSFDLVVAPEWRGRLSLGWGNPAQRTTHLKVAGCRWMMSPSQSSPPGAWLGFAGGYWVPRPACVTVLVRVGHRQRRVRIGLGAACPGEQPPPRPLAGT
jgi:hypothetical protein